MALPELRRGRRWYDRLFGALFVYAGPPFPGGFRLLLAVDFCRAVAAVFRPAGAGKEAPAADLTAVQLPGVEDGTFQLRLLRQHGMSEPPADQTAGDGLRADAVQQQAIALRKVAAALRQPPHAARLSRRQAEKCSVRQALDRVKSGHRHPPL